MQRVTRVWTHTHAPNGTLAGAETEISCWGKRRRRWWWCRVHRRHDGDWSVKTCVHVKRVMRVWTHTRDPWTNTQASRRQLECGYEGKCRWQDKRGLCCKLRMWIWSDDYRHIASSCRLELLFELFFLKTWGLKGDLGDGQGCVCPTFFKLL